MTLSCDVFFILDKIIWLYTIVMLIYAVLSWVPDLRGGWSGWIAMLVEPVLAPVRRVIPPAAGIDWSFLVVMLGLWLLNSFIVRPNEYACF